MKLASLVVLLVFCRKLQTNPVWLVAAPRYTRPNIPFYAHPPRVTVRVNEPADST